MDGDPVWQVGAGIIVAGVIIYLLRRRILALLRGAGTIVRGLLRNQARETVILAVAVTIVFLGLFPPWTCYAPKRGYEAAHYWPGGAHTLGFRGSTSCPNPSLDLKRLFVSWTLVLVAGSALIAVLPRKRPTATKPETSPPEPGKDPKE
jgi:hypothetical protein